MLQKHTLRLDRATAEAVAACARAERKSTADVLREGARLRLEVGALIEPVRLAIAEIEATVLARIDERIASLHADLVARVVEAEQRERAITRRDIEDFIGGLSELEQARGGRAPAIAAPRDVLSK